MPNNTLTLSLDGEVTIKEFADGVKRLAALIAALTRHVGGKRTGIEWMVEDLHAGSATATIAAVSGDVKAIEKVVEAYAVIGEALAHGTRIPAHPTVEKEAVAITGLINGHIKAVRFMTEAGEHTVTAPYGEGTQSPQLRYALGSITGLIETVSRRRGYKFTLYDDLFDRPVKCFLAPSEEDIMRNVWGKRARVSGRVGREPDTGYPVTVRSIKQVEVLPEIPPGSYERACGILEGRFGDQASEDLIRSNRDA